MTAHLLSIQKKLEQSSGKKLKVKINDNRSTMLSVRWEPDYTRVSLHRIFLDAPQNVMDDLACYLKEGDQPVGFTVRAFIEDNLKKLDYSHTIDAGKLYVQGRVYNLKEIYNRLNDEYFDGRLKLFITWFGKHELKARSRINFGLYYDPLKLIKINRLMDKTEIPEYVLSYVIYHEMLHFVCPSYYDEKGIHRIHTKEFKAMERQYEHYKRALKWIKDHQSDLFPNY